MALKSMILNLKASDISKIVNKRLEEFKAKNTMPNDEWFSELCFCILTANSRAKTAIEIQKELGAKGFKEKSVDELENVISNHGHRFSRMKAGYIAKARAHEKIKDELSKFSGNQEEMRRYLCENILGLGMKESSHFLRNIGFSDLAILDRHILAILKKYGYIEEIPKTLTKKTYISIEKIVKKIGLEVNMNMAELDLYMWFLKTGEVLK